MTVRSALAATRRHDVAVGASPWVRAPRVKQSLEGTIGARYVGPADGLHDEMTEEWRVHVAPLGLGREMQTFHGLTPVATTGRPVGTDGRMVGELGGQFEESSRLEEAIKSNLEALGYGE